jgi:hypothetical protein
MRAVLSFLFVAIIIASAECAAYAQNYLDAIPNVPAPVKVIKLGMSISEVQRLLPDTKSLGAAGGSRVSLYAYFKPPELWDAAMLDFVDGKLQGINFLIGVKKTSDLFKRSEQMLRETINMNGGNYARIVAMNSSHKPVPAYWWSKQNVSLFAIGPAAEIAISGKQISGDTSLQVGVATKERSRDELFQVATPDELTDILFRALSVVEPK